MKEGLVELPADMVIFSGSSRTPETKLVELSLTDIPDHVAPEIQRQINFIKMEQAKGNNKACAYGFYHSDPDNHYEDPIAYQVRLRVSPHSTPRSLLSRIRLT